MFNQLSNRAFAWLIAALVCMTFTAVLIIRSWNELTAVAHYIGYGAAGACAIAVLYCLYRVWDDVHTRHIKRQQLTSTVKHLEWKETQELLHRQDMERRDREMEIQRIERETQRDRYEHERLLIAAQWQAQHAIIPEGHTLYTIDQSAPEGYLTIQSPRPAALLKGATQPEEDESTIEIPQAPVFSEMKHLLQPDRMVLCYTANGPAYGTTDDLLSMAVTGKPGRGKTTALMYYVVMLLQAGAEVWVWDPHGAMNDLALLNNRPLPGMPNTAKVIYLDRKPDIVASVPKLQKALESRDDYYRQSHQVMHPLLLLADELPVLADYDDQVEKEYKQINKQHAKDDEPAEEVPSLIYLIRRFVLEARKWKCFFIGSGQSIDAEILPTKVTDALNSRIVFFNSDRKARMSGLESDAIKQLLPVIRRAGSGVMIFDCARWNAPVIGAIPMISVDDMMTYLGINRQKQATSMMPDVPTSSRPALRIVEADTEAAIEVAQSPFEVDVVALDDETLSELETHVFNMLSQGISQKQIIQNVWGVSGGDKYIKASAEMTKIIAKLVQRKHA